jgi:two-component system OmpR family sensor kinase
VRKTVILAIAVAPSLLLLAIALLFDTGVFENLILAGQYRIDAVGFLSRLAVVLGVVMLFALLTFWSAERRTQKTLQAEKEIMQTTRRGFFRRLDHELKNPLTILRIGMANLHQSSNLAPEESASIARMGQQVDRLQKLVQDLRWLSELEERPLEQYPVDLADVLTEAAALVRNNYPDRVIEINLQQVPWPIAPVSGDRDLLVLAFRNLIDNALKYSSPRDRVEIRATDDGNWATIEVADTGLGIPTDQLPRIFEELYRADNVHGISGSGLGLALVWRILKLHGGRIGVRSREAEGTVVRVRLRTSARDA